MSSLSHDVEMRTARLFKIKTCSFEPEHVVVFTHGSYTFVCDLQLSVILDDNMLCNKHLDGRLTDVCNEEVQRSSN